MSAPMPTRLCLLLVLAVGAVCLLPVGCGSSEDALVSVTPTEHDFGRIRHGDVKYQDFTIRNNSERAIAISKAEPNCGCFKTVPMRKRRLDPGQETVLKIKFESGAVPAQRLKGKFVHVMTDHPEAQGLKIPLEGHIFAPVALSVEGGLDKLYFGLIGNEASQAPRKCFIRREPRYEAELDTSVQTFEKGYAIRPLTLEPLFDVDIEPTKDGYAIAVALKADAANPGQGHQLMGSITFRVRESGPGLKERVIPYTVKLHGTWPTR